MPTLNDLLTRLWDDYAGLNPQAKAIHSLLAQRGETVHNDHIALRTFDDPRAGAQVLAKPFTDLGYEPMENYQFTAKKLLATHYEHPDPLQPKVFISELKLAEFSDELRAIVKRLLDQMDPALTQRWDLPVIGRPWDVSFADYEKLANESEYAGWVAAFGFRANHFTVSINELRSFDTLEKFNAFLKESGFTLNSSGGEIKGSPADLLEQSSTLADLADVTFSDGTHRIPACYYEFAKRYNKPDGSRFQGFVAKSADKIFESTDRR